MTKTLFARITDTARAVLIDISTHIPSGFQNGKLLERQSPEANYATTHFGPLAQRIDSDAENFPTHKQQYEQNYVVSDTDEDSRKKWEEIIAQLKQDTLDRQRPFPNFNPEPYISYDRTSREIEPFSLSLFTPYFGGRSLG